ncbi:hypothetical protein D1AOALGA4SA_9758 [Olavius algarvensis Delta 1 endosymbiont]|nr:hypothetical protein D1AOALGA4SA_9758 [Olavius algarvensis Delta 1 endosymbiont]
MAVAIRHGFDGRAIYLHPAVIRTGQSKSMATGKKENK